METNQNLSQGQLKLAFLSLVLVHYQLSTIETLHCEVGCGITV